MAKKKKAGKSSGRGSTKNVKRSSSARKPKGPRSQTLPGLEQVRNARLDQLCEAIGDERETMNTARTEEQALLLATLQAMQKADVTVYRHARVEVSRVPGAEKIRVRITAEQGDAGTEDLEQGAATGTDGE